MLTLLATITASQGDYVGLDKGLIDGLRPGDQGRVFYTLKVDGAERTIEAGTLQLTEVDDFASQAVPLGSSRLKPGFTVFFPNVPERQTPAASSCGSRPTDSRPGSSRWLDAILRGSRRFSPGIP